jgi:hypothetical protein
MATPADLTSVDATRRESYDPWVRPVAASLIVLGFIALAVTPACGKRKTDAAVPSPLLSTPAPHDEAIDVARAAADPDALRRALVRPHRLGSALGAHTFKATSKLRVTESGAEVEALDVSESLELAATGAFHVLSKNSKDYGREAIFVPAAAGSAGELWIRPGFGKYHHRAPAEPDEPARLLDETFATLGADFDLVAASAAVSDAGSATVAGRPGRKITLALGKPRAHKESVPERAWRDGVTVQALAGEVVLDEATGLPLAGQLDAKLTFVREGHTYEMTLSATHAVADVGGSVAVAPPAPEDAVETPARSHDFEDREELLHGIAPPAKRGPTAATPR